MRKKYIYFVLTFLLSLTSFSQKVTIIPTGIDNQNINTGPINLGSKTSAKVSLSVTVEMPAIPGNDGTISIFSLNGLNENVVIGGNGGTLFFGEGKTAVRSFVVTLSAGDFDTSQGSIYAEYKTFSGVTYKSPNISVIKNGVTPPSPPSTSNNSEIIPYGGTPLLPKFTVYYDVIHQDWVNSANQIIKPNTPFYDPATLRERTFFKDGREQLGKKVNFYVVDFFTNLNEPKKINNTISKSQYLQYGESPTIITGNHATVSSGSTTISINNYQWQSRIKYPLTWFNFAYYFQTYGWKDIPGATQMNYNPPASNDAIEYRRLLIENPSDTNTYRKCATSNIIEVVPFQENLAKNSICCDQTISGNIPVNEITGNSIYDASYQWLFSEDNINWSPILGATEQNYTPTSLNPENSIYESTHYYKRTLYDSENNINYISNTIQVNFQVRPTNESVQIFPNPVTTQLTISSPLRIISNIIITNSTGNIVTPASLSIRNPSMIHLDVSNLRFGIYFMEMILSTPGATRVDKYQTKFIKQ